jgi:hypothetical protein
MIAVSSAGSLQVLNGGSHAGREMTHTFVFLASGDAQHAFGS